MSPYAKTTIEPDQHAWFEQLAHHSATVAAQALARGTMRLGQAHKYMAAAHIAALFEGAGEDDARRFLDELVAALTEDAPGVWTRDFLDERAAARKAAR